MEAILPTVVTIAIILYAVRMFVAGYTYPDKYKWEKDWDVIEVGRVITPIPVQPPIIPLEVKVEPTPATLPPNPVAAIAALQEVELNPPQEPTLVKPIPEELLRECASALIALDFKVRYSKEQAAKTLQQYPEIANAPEPVAAFLERFFQRE